MYEEKPSYERPEKLKEKPKDCTVPNKCKRCYPGVKGHPSEERKQSWNSI